MNWTWWYSYHFPCNLLYLDVPYEIVIYTSDISGAGTDSNIFITIYGLLGIQTGEVLLTDNKKKRKDSFNRGSVDVFVREVKLILTEYSIVEVESLVEKTF